MNEEEIEVFDHQLERWDAQIERDFRTVMGIEEELGNPVG